MIRRSWPKAEAIRGLTASHGWPARRESWLGCRALERGELSPQSDEPCGDRGGAAAVEDWLEAPRPSSLGQMPVTWWLPMGQSLIRSFLEPSRVRGGQPVPTLGGWNDLVCFGHEVD